MGEQVSNGETCDKCGHVADSLLDAWSHRNNSRVCLQSQLTAALARVAELEGEVERPRNGKVAESGTVIGDYVFASRWPDCDPGDPWAVGFIKSIDNGRAVVVDAAGNPIGHPSWPYCQKISKEQGDNILKHLPSLEGHARSPQLMAYVAAIITPAPTKE